MGGAGLPGGAGRWLPAAAAPILGGPPLCRYFGDSASPLITTDLAKNSIYSGSVDLALSALVAINTFTKLPALVLCLQARRVGGPCRALRCGCVYVCGVCVGGGGSLLPWADAAGCRHGRLAAVLTQQV